MLVIDVLQFAICTVRSEAFSGVLSTLGLVRPTSRPRCRQVD